MKYLSSITLIAGVSLLAAGLTSPVLAQDTAAEPVFSVQRTSSGQVGAGAWAFERGDYAEAERFGRVSLARPARLSPPRRSIAYANWCAALSMTGQHDDAAAACEEAIALRPDNWRAHLNLGSARLRAGDRALAQAAFAEARRLAPGEPDVTRAAALLDSRSLAAAR